MAEQHKPRLMINGLNPNPKEGKMSRAMLEDVLSSGQFEVIGSSLTGPDVPEERYKEISLIKPAEREKRIERIKEKCFPFISIDATLGTALNDNADFYCRHGLPFVMLTTGGDRDALVQRVLNSEIPAVIGTNMCVALVSAMHNIEQDSLLHKGEMADCCIEISESHQQGKKDASGTGREFGGYFKTYGLPIDPAPVKAVTLKGEPIDMEIKIGPNSIFRIIRNPETQRKIGVPEEYLGGHGWHSYWLRPTSDKGIAAVAEFGRMLATKFFTPQNPALRGYDISGEYWFEMKAISPDKTVVISTCEPEEGGLVLSHNLCGRKPYVRGTFDYAVPHAWKMMQAMRPGDKGRVDSMMDAIKAA